MLHVHKRTNSAAMNGFEKYFLEMSGTENDLRKIGHGGIRTHTVEILSFLTPASWSTCPIMCILLHT